MKLPEYITIELNDVDFTKILTIDEARGLAEGMLGVETRKSITLTGQWMPRRSPYANKEHRDGCLCDYHVARLKRLTGVGILIMTYVDTQGAHTYTPDPTITEEEWRASKGGSIFKPSGEDMFYRVSRMKYIREHARTDFYDALDAVADFLQGVPRG